LYKLYYYPNNASLAPHFLMHEMEVDFELVLVDRENNKQKTTEYLKLNPAGRIPTLIDDHMVLFESPAICIYLCEENPEKELMPSLGSPNRAKFFQWLTFLNNTLQAELMIYYYPEKHTTNKNCISSIVEAQEERIAEALSILNKELENKEYLLGEKITACDFFLFMLALWSLKIKKSPLTFSNINPYLKKLAKHKTIQSVCKKEKIDLKIFN